jgi:hypothetical protein
MGFFEKLLKNKKREATELDVIMVVIGIYEGFYKNYGIDKKLDPDTAFNFFTQGTLEANLTFNNYRKGELEGILAFMVEISENSEDFPSLVMEFSNLKHHAGQTDEWHVCFKKILNVMKDKGFVTGLHYE